MRRRRLVRAEFPRHRLPGRAQSAPGPRRGGGSSLATGGRRVPSPVVASAVGMLLAAVATGLRGQDVVRLTEARDMCRDCISFETVAVLGGDYDSDDLLSLGVAMNRAASGRTFVHDFGVGPTEIYFYGPAGELEVAIRRPGDGPGEYRDPKQTVELPGGRLVVFDRGNLRLSLLESDGTFVESGRFPLPHGLKSVAQAINDSVLLVAAHIPTPGRIGIPYHLIHVDGTILESFGPEVALAPGAEDIGWRYIRLIDGDRFLVAHRRSYRIERWETRSATRVWLREADWFEGQVTIQGKKTARASIEGIHFDGRHLWTLSAVADPDYEWPSPETRIAVTPEFDNAVADYVVEVIDLEANEVIASQWFDENMRDLYPDGTAVHWRTDELGVPRYEIRALKLNAGPR